MNILLLEDNGTVFSFLMEELENLGHKIELATKVSRAIDLMDDDEFDIKFDCIIVDLNINPSGLDADYFNKSEYDRIWGWVWLENFVFPKDEEWKKRTIIYSGYTQILYSKVDKKDYESIYIVEKNNAIDNDSNLVDDLGLICTYLKKIEKLQI